MKRKNTDKYNINNFIPILDTVPNSILRNLYCDFLDNRARMNCPLTVKGFQHLIERVRELAGLDEDKKLVWLDKQLLTTGRMFI